MVRESSNYLGTQPRLPFRELVSEDVMYSYLGKQPACRGPTFADVDGAGGVDEDGDAAPDGG